jgi:archaemetzincin
MDVLIFWDQRSPPGLQLPVARTISHILPVNTEVVENPVVIRGYERDRNQHNARKILDGIQNIYTRQHGTDRMILLVVPFDLFIPGSDFVFGIARPRIQFGIVSTARLHNGFYGREHSDDDVIDRIAKEGAHEIGHLLGLEHCENPECVMFCPQTLDDLDRKKKMLCATCAGHLETLLAGDAVDLP